MGHELASRHAGSDELVAGKLWTDGEEVDLAPKQPGDQREQVLWS
jgi:hypothetical protein